MHRSRRRRVAPHVAHHAPRRGSPDVVEHARRPHPMHLFQTPCSPQASSRFGAHRSGRGPGCGKMGVGCVGVHDAAFGIGSPDLRRRRRRPECRTHRDLDRARTRRRAASGPCRRRSRRPGAFLALAGFIGSFLYGVDTADIVGMSAATAVLLVSGLLAAYIPARRAGRIDPVLVLRED